MKEIGYMGIFLGAVSALLAIFVTQLVRNAFKTRLVAFKASAYLASTLTSITNQKSFLHFAAMAKTWGDERTTLLASLNSKASADDIKAVDAVDAKYRDAISQAFENDDNVFKILATFEPYKKSPAALNEYAAAMVRSEDDLRNNVTWISDEDATYLGWVASHHTVTVRQKLMHVVLCTRLLMAYGTSAEVDPKAVRPVVQALFTSLVDALRAFFPLRERVERIRKMNLLELLLLKLND